MSSFLCDIRDELLSTDGRPERHMSYGQIFYATWQASRHSGCSVYAFLVNVWLAGLCV